MKFVYDGFLSADSRPRQLRPRPNVPQQIKNFPIKKKPSSLVKGPKFYKNITFFKIIGTFF